jgi:hypothetical protein
MTGCQRTVSPFSRSRIRHCSRSRSAGRRLRAPPRRQAVSVCSRRISVSSAEPYNGHIRMTRLACPRARGTGTEPRAGPGLVGGCRRHPQRLRAAGLRPSSAVGGHCRRRVPVRGHGALRPAGPPHRSACGPAGGSRGCLDGVCHGAQHRGCRDQQPVRLPPGAAPGRATGAGAGPRSPGESGGCQKACPAARV